MPESVREPSSGGHYFSDSQYSRLRGHFGYTAQWWPGTPLEVAVSALLVQRCDWTAASRAIGRLRGGDLLSLPALAAASPRVIEDSLRGVSFASRKASRLNQIARSLVGRGHREIEPYLDPSRETTALRQDLLALEGIGPETADCILLFASQHPCFVVDGYTRRVFQRLGVFPGFGVDFWALPYGSLQAFFESNILNNIKLYRDFEFPPGLSREVALFRDFHAQLVELGKHHCLSVPRCHVSGGNGWQDYAFCESHCRPAECRRCPMVNICTVARDSTPELSGPGGASKWK